MDRNYGQRRGWNRGPSTRGRGGGGRSMRGGSRSHAGTTSATPAPPYGALLGTIVSKDLGSQNPEYSNAKISGCEYVASFNWLTCKKPTIVLPGMPPKWTPLTEPKELEEDSGEYFRDVNAAHYSDHPIEPAVRALLAQNFNTQTTDVDLFACGSTLGNLLRFVRDEHQDFRFVVETIGETVFFIRRLNSPTEKILDVRGYGHAFPEKYTTFADDVRGSDSHQRLIMYNFAGFRCIIRSEGDGYLADKLGQQEVPRELLSLPELEGLVMKSGGTRIPQAALFDLKTRSAKRQDDYLAKEMGRLWIRQIPNFVLAYHERGTFKDIRVQDIQQEMASWEKDHAREIGKLATLLATITDRARNKPDERFEVCCRSPGVLEFRHVGGIFAPALPDDLRQLWMGAGEGGDLSDTGASSQDADSGADSGAGFGSSDEDEGSEKDYTACSGECEYCGHCKR